VLSRAGTVPVMRRSIILVLLLSVAGCGDGSASSTTTSSSTVTVPPATTTLETTTTAVRAGAPPAILAVVSGRGDDGSLEITVWFDTEPLRAGTTLVVGIDSDDSYPGTGDVRPHLDGYASLTAGTRVEVTLVSEGEVVVAPGLGIAETWLSWAAQGEVFRAFFVQDLTVRSGSVWVVATMAEEVSPLGVAGVPLGESCSYRGSGIAAEEPPGGVPDAPRTCSYR